MNDVLCTDDLFAPSVWDTQNTTVLDIFRINTVESKPLSQNHMGQRD